MVCVCVGMCVCVCVCVCMCVGMCVCVYVYVCVCAVPYGNMGCRGGSVFNAYLYMINSGVSTYNCYPYRGRVSTVT